MNRLTAGLCLAALASLGTATAQTVVNLTPTADTYTQQGTPTTNYGTATTILIRRDPAGTLTRGAYFQFNLSGLPAGTITNARLQLFGSQDQGGTGIDTKIHGGTNTATWSETALTYNNSLQLTSTDFSGTPLTTVHVNPPPAATYSWDVTSFIASRRSAGHATLGLGYVTTDTYRSTFNSKEAASNRPVLVVTIGNPSPDTTPPSSPGAVSFSNVTANAVTASWGAATDNVGVVGYDYRVTEGHSGGTWVNAGTGLSVTITGLNPSTGYTIDIQARDAAGNVSVVPASNLVTTLSAPGDTTPPSTPGTLTFSNVTATSVTASWGAATDNIGVTSYEYRLNGGNWAVVGNVLSTSITGLTASTSYTVDVRARDAAGNVSVTPRSGSVTTPSASGWTPTCPSNYNPAPGENINFPTPTGNRAFSLNLPPASFTGPRPVWVPLTGSVESTTENLDTRGGNRALTAQGYIVIGPVRKCAGSGAGAVSANGTANNGGTCNAAGTGGWNWNPWTEGRTFDATGNQWKTNEGPDSLFFEAIVKCVATENNVDQSRIYIGGISSGGTMTNRALLFRSDFWAGGMPISGEWYMTQNDGTPFGGNPAFASEFPARVQAVANNPYAIYQGRVGPFPLQTSLNPMIVITMWGGNSDVWPADGSQANYRPTTQVASNYFNSFSNVVQVSCSSSPVQPGYGHQWPTVNRAAFNQWALATLTSHPKGTPKANFVLTAPPSGYTCKTGVYTDHYTQQPPPTDTTPPSAPGAVSVSNVTSNSATISWGAATDNSGGSGIGGYDYRLNGGSWISVSNVLSTSVGGLLPSTNYTVDVRARDVAGNTSLTFTSSSFTTTAGQAGGAMNWPMFNKDYSNTRNSPDTTISAANVSTLHVLWRNGSPTTGSLTLTDTTLGGVAGTPVIVDGTVYVSDFNGWVRAIDANTGTEIWKRQVTPTGSTLRQTTPSVFVTTDTVYAGGNIGMVYALNRSNGTLKWQRQVETTPNSRVSSSPIVFDNKIIVGSGSYQVWLSATPMFRGSVKFVDATTGAMLPYTTDMCPSGQCGGGITVWSTAAIDPATRTGFIGTGQAYAQPAGPYSDALVAFDIDTGAKKWVGQFEANDVWNQSLSITGHDHDIGAAPNLFTANIPNVGVRDVVGVGNKGGFYNVYDRATGQKYWGRSFAGSPLGGFMTTSASDGTRIYGVYNGFNGGSGANGAVPTQAHAIALNPDTGATIWDHPLSTNDGVLGGGVTVANGLVYFATWNGVLHVLNAATGAEVKTVQIGPVVGTYQQAVVDGFPNGSASGPMLYNGKVYVGYGFTWVLNSNGGVAAIGL